MKHFLVACICCVFIISCTKSNLNDSLVLSENFGGKVIPDVPQCGTGYHWDYNIRKCEENCPTGYHNDPITGSCTPDGGVGPLRICSEDYAQFGLMGSTYSAAVDSFGQWHNEYVINLLGKMEQQNVNLLTDTLEDFLRNTLIAFFATKGITTENSPLPNFDLSDTVWNISSYSTTAQNILSSLKFLIDNYTESNHLWFIPQCEVLETGALNLQNDNEAISVGFNSKHND